MTYASVELFVGFQWVLLVGHKLWSRPRFEMTTSSLNETWVHINGMLHAS